MPFSRNEHSRAEEPELESSPKTLLSELGPNAAPIKTLGSPLNLEEERPPCSALGSDTNEFFDLIEGSEAMF